MPDQKRILGQHLTSVEVFSKFILPKIRDNLYDYTWVDLYCGEGNLILPILTEMPPEKRANFFREHIFLFDIDINSVEKAINNAVKLGIPEQLARKNIKQHDSLKEFPKLESNFSIFHITNPPYLYIGYIKKHPETQKHLQYFQEKNKGYQDLYQIALMGDLRNEIERMIYIIPSNFLFSASGVTKIRRDFLQNYRITSAVIFEKKIFEFTGTNVALLSFERKEPSNEDIEFEGLRIDNEETRKKYTLKYENNYRAGGEFFDFCRNRKNKIKVRFYLKQSEVISNPGEDRVEVIDSSEYIDPTYVKKTVQVSQDLARKIKNNTLFIRTVDSGAFLRAGLYTIRDEFCVDGILVSKKTYRTSPIQIFFGPELSREQQLKLKEYFNATLESLRKQTDSEFMTTYKYSRAKYTRKYLGLKQAKKLIQTFELS